MIPKPRELEHADPARARVVSDEELARARVVEHEKHPQAAQS